MGRVDDSGITQGATTHAGGRGSVRADVARCMHGGDDGASPSGTDLVHGEGP